MNIERRNPEMSEHAVPPVWEMAVEWARVVGLVVAVLGLALLVAVLEDGDAAGGSVFVGVWLGTGVYVVGSFALPDLRARLLGLKGVGVSGQLRAMWGALSRAGAADLAQSAY